MSQKSVKLFLSSPALKDDEVCQVSSILDIEKIEKFHKLSQNEPKSQIWGQKWAIFWPQNGVRGVRICFYLCQPKKLMRYVKFYLFWILKKYRNFLIYPKMSQKRSFWGKKGQFLAPKLVRSVQHYFHLLRHEILVQYPKFHPFSWSLSMVSTLIPHCKWQLTNPFLMSNLNLEFLFKPSFKFFKSFFPVFLNVEIFWKP